MWTYIILLLLCSNSIKSNQILDDLNRNENLAEYVRVSLKMIQRFISPNTNTLIIMERCEYICQTQQRHHTTLVEYFLHNLNDTLSIQLFFGPTEDRPWDYNIFIVDSWWAFEALSLHIPFTKHEREYYFFILLTYSPVHVRHRNLMKIFELCFRSNVKNAVVMNNSPEDDLISFYTYKIFTSEACFKPLTIYEINRYQNGQLLNDVLFADDFTNFQGCTLTVTAHIVEPLISFVGNTKNPTHLKDMRRLSGIEGDILKLLADSLNFKIHMRFPKENNAIKLHHNSRGSFRDLEKRKAHIAIGGLSSTMKNGFKFSATASYHTTPYVFVVRGGLIFGPIRQLLNPLNTSTWTFLLLHIIISMIFIKIIESLKTRTIRNFIFGSRNKHPMRNMITILLGNPLPTHIIPKRNFARFMLITWLFLTFEIRNGYQGKMFDSLRHRKRMPIPRKISELIDSDYTLLTHVPTDLYPTNKTHIVPNSSSITQILDAIQDRNERLTTTSLLDYLGLYNYRHLNTSTLRIVDEKIHIYQCVMYLNKHSILRESIDRNLKLFASSGITSHIAKTYRHSYIKSLNIMWTQNVNQITFQNLTGLFSLFGTMLQLSIYTFVLELLTRKSKRIKKLMDWLN